jgi:hypothetical protein
MAIHPVCLSVCDKPNCIGAQSKRDVNDLIECISTFFLSSNVERIQQRHGPTHTHTHEIPGNVLRLPKHHGRTKPVIIR